MAEFDEIYLVWRKGAGSSRHKVGILKKTADGKYVFNYASGAEKLQKKEGFIPYTEFQDIHKEYNSNVVDIFAQRLTKTDRPDIGTLLDFWEVDKDRVNDKFYLLGKTQGLVATDNFEFLARYKLQPDTHFLTELSGLSKNQLPSGTLVLGDVLRFEKERDNLHDKYAVKVFKGEQFLGYVKKYHSKIFYDEGAEKLNLSVKAIEQNGIIKRVFIKVFSEN